MRKVVLLILLICCSFLSFGQNEYRTGLLPEINLNKKWAEKWRTNFKIESRMTFSSGKLSGEKYHRFHYLLSDISAVGSYKVGLNSKLAFGYLLRITTSGVVHRAIQQYSIVKGLRKGRMGHRIAADQTFSPFTSPQFRLRYRISFDIPLQGLQVDAKEFYFKISNEYLGILQQQTFEIETRVVPVFGYAFNDANKLELGLDYRFKEILNERNHDFWTTISWFYSF